MLELENGFYLYVNYDTINGVKYQTIRTPFEVSNGKVIVSSCDIFDDETDNTILSQHPSSIDISHYTEQDLIRELETFNTSYSVTRNSINDTIDSVKKEFIKLNLNCGIIYKGIYRPLLNENIAKHSDNLINEFPKQDAYADLPIMDRQEYSNRLNQLELLLDDLFDVFNVVAPYKENLSCFGNKIRNIIILACTEIDSMMKGILEKSKVKPQFKFYTTNDYIKLNVPLQLNEYTLSLSRFEELGDFKPFFKWNSNNPTGSLSWYLDYNNVKHDRESNFSKANLTNAIDSIMALAALMVSQFGYRNELWHEKVGKIIKIKTEPQWNIRELYIPRREGEEFTPVDYPF